MRISDWSSDVCSSDLACRLGMDERRRHFLVVGACPPATPILLASQSALPGRTRRHAPETRATEKPAPRSIDSVGAGARSEEHTSELQSLMRISYAGFCLKIKNYKITRTTSTPNDI